MTTVVRVRATTGGLDAFKQPITTGSTEVDIPGGILAPGGSTETVEAGRQTVETVATLYFRNTWPDIVESDQLRVDGELYNVDGEPQKWQAQRGGVGGLVVRLSRVGG